MDFDTFLRRKNLNILAIGDIVGDVGCSFLREKLRSLKETYKIDLVVANGENSAEGNGLTFSSAKYILESGVDVITTGNHAFRRREARDVFSENENILRPANYPKDTTPGKGYCYVKVNGMDVLVINVLGVTFLESLGCPARTVDKILELNKKAKVVIFDLHAEATAEKRAMGFYLDGRVSAIFGTHTHVQTSDECILEKGTGYITDVGMTGPIRSVLGIEPEIIVNKMLTHLPEKFFVAKAPCKMECILFTVDENTGFTKNVKRLIVT